jgi:hypothetical protein
MTRKQIKCIRKQSFVNRTIKLQDQLPAEAIETFTCKSHVSRKEVSRLIISEEKWRVFEGWWRNGCVARCITITHQATHSLLYSNSSPRKAFLPSPNHRTHRISLRVTFGCSLLWKWASRWTRFATMEDIKSNATAQLRKIPKEAFQRGFQQWQHRWNKCVCVCVCMCVRARARAQGSYFEGD